MVNILSLLSTVIIVPFVGMIFALMAKDDDETSRYNVFNVGIFTVIVNLVLIWRVFWIVNVSQPGLQLIEKFNWLETPNIDIIFGIDVFSLLLIGAVHLAFLIVMVGVRNSPFHPKSMMVFALMFLGSITGFFIAADIFSFYIFFEAMLLPLYMLIGKFGDIKKPQSLYRFFLYNLLGAVIMFVAVVMIFDFQSGMELSRVRALPMQTPVQYFIWGAVFVSFLFRIPVWPFHYWISVIGSGVKNPLVFLVVNLLPLTGVYGFVRFLPQTLPDGAVYYILALEIISVVTMLFIALIAFINKDFQYKMFAYLTVYYIMYLLGVLSRTELILFNIGFSFFSFLIIVATLEVVSQYIHFQQENLDIGCEGLLCATPRLSFIYSFFILAAVGLPLSSLFMNNFLLLADLLAFNLRMGLVVVFSLILLAGTLLGTLYRLKDRSKFCADQTCAQDISTPVFAFGLFVVFVLLMSFIRPLWFVVGV